MTLFLAFLDFRVIWFSFPAHCFRHISTLPSTENSSDWKYHLGEFVFLIFTPLFAKVGASDHGLYFSKKERRMG